MRTIAIDTETFLITRARPAPLVVCLSYADDDHAEVIPRGAGLHAWLIDCLNNGYINFVGHNVAYDFKCIAASYPDLLPLIFHAYRSGRVTDTGIRQQLFDIAIGQTYANDAVKYYSLSKLHERIFGTELEGKEGGDAWRMRYGELYDVPFEKWPIEAIDYSRHDAEATFTIWREQEKVSRVLRDDPFQAYVSFCLALIESYGMRTDKKAVNAFKKHNEKITGLKFNLNI